MELIDAWLDEISNKLRQKNEKIAVAESVTSGFLQLILSQMEDASSFYCGGMTTYTLQEKVNLLKINHKQAIENNCVSKQVTENMGVNVMDLFKSDWAIAVTGYATPVAESDFKLFAYYSIHYQDKILASDKINAFAIVDPLDVQYSYTESILKKFSLILEKSRQDFKKHNFSNL